MCHALICSARCLKRALGAFGPVTLGVSHKHEASCLVEPLHESDMSRIMAKHQWSAGQMHICTVYNAILHHHRDGHKARKGLHCIARTSNIRLHNILELAREQARRCILEVQHYIGIRAFLGCAPARQG